MPPIGRVSRRRFLWRPSGPQRVGMYRMATRSVRSEAPRTARGWDFDAGLDRLREVFAKVERWDEIVAESREVTSARSQLAFSGSLPDLERSIGRSAGQAEAAASLGMDLPGSGGRQVGTRA